MGAPALGVAAAPLDRACGRNKLAGRPAKWKPGGTTKNTPRRACGGIRRFHLGRTSAVTIRTAAISAIVAAIAVCGPVFAQDLGPQVRKLADGVYVVAGVNFNSNAGIVLTQDGVVVIDTGQNAIEARKILDVVKKLTPMPVRFVLDTEPHPDHTTGHFVFSPPAAIVAAAGAGESMRGREREDPQRIQKAAAASPEMKAALEGYRFIPPHIEYQQKATLNVGERTFELMYMKGV